MNIEYSIVIPAYNESPCISDLIIDLKKIDIKDNQNTEIVFVDDGSIDNTFDLFKSWKPKFIKCNILQHPINLGYGAAINSGIFLSKGSWVVSMDSDGQHNSKDAITLLKKLSKHKIAVMIIGIRNESINISTRGFAKFILRKAQKYFLGVDLKDANSGMKAVNKSIYKIITRNMSIPFDMSYSQYIPLIISILDKRFVVEQSIQVNRRVDGYSKISSLDFLGALSKFFYIAFTLSPRRIGYLFGINLILFSIIYSGIIISINNRGIPNGGLFVAFLGFLIILYIENRQISAMNLLNELKRKIILKAYLKK